MMVAARGIRRRIVNALPLASRLAVITYVDAHQRPAAASLRLANVWEATRVQWTPTPVRLSIRTQACPRRQHSSFSVSTRTRETVGHYPSRGPLP
jgi:hypothetical protein